MRPTRYRHGRSLPLSFLMSLLLTLVLAGCELPVVMDANAAATGTPLPRTAVSPHAQPGICDATDISQVLVPVPAQPRDGAPRDVRVRYRRDDGVYGNWGLHVWQVDAAGQYVADYPGVSWDAPLARAGIDGYGAYFDIRATAFTHPAAAGFGFIVHPAGQGGDPGVDRTWSFTDGGEFWLRSGDATVYRADPVASTPDIGTVRVHYRRFDNAYDQWGLHLWPGSGIDVARLDGLALDQWNAPVPLSAMPNHVLPVLNPRDDATRRAVELIVHGLPSKPNGGVNDKDGWNDNIRIPFAALTIADGVGHVWLVQGTPKIFTAPPDLRRVSTTDARAFWLGRDRLQWPRAATMPPSAE
jgi:hypothetical protein